MLGLGLKFTTEFNTMLPFHWHSYAFAFDYNQNENKTIKYFIFTNIFVLEKYEYLFIKKQDKNIPHFLFVYLIYA